MKVILTAPAARELDEIARYVEQDDPSAAERLVLDLRKRCFALSDNPERGSVAGTRRGVTIRRIVHRPYLIFYSISASFVRIHRIVHGARAPQSLLKDLDLS